MQYVSCLHLYFTTLMFLFLLDKLKPSEFTLTTAVTVDTYQQDFDFTGQRMASP